MLEHIGIGIKKILIESGNKALEEKRKWRDALVESGVHLRSDKIVRLNQEIASISKQLDDLKEGK